jgi:hypothetical protein
LRNRGKELEYNLLYDRASRKINLTRSTSAAAAPPEFADRSLTLFSRFSSEGELNDFPVTTTTSAGVRFAYTSLTNGWGGKMWNLSESYDATANKLVVNYSVAAAPNAIKVELKNSADQTVFEYRIENPGVGNYQQVVVDLPNHATLANVQHIAVVAEDGDGGDFRIHSLNLQHLASSQNLTANPNLSSGSVSMLPGNPPAQLFSSNPASSLERPDQRLVKLNYDVTSNGYAGFTVNFDPAGNTNGADVSALTSLTFGVESAKVKRLKIEIDDAQGNRAVLYATGIGSSRSFYQAMNTLLAGSVNLTQVKRINFVVDQTSVASGDEVGNLTLEIGGLLFP